jgi:hypothetical protein
MSKLLIFMTPERKNRAAIQQRSSSLMAGSHQRDRASKIRVIVPARGTAVATMPRPISASSEIGPAPSTTNHPNRIAQKQVLIQSLVGELNNQGQDQHRQSGEPRRKAEHQQRRADDLDRFSEPCRRYRVQPRNRVLVRREINGNGPALQLDHARSPEDPGEP